MIQTRFIILNILFSLALICGCSTSETGIIGVKCYQLPAGERETIDSWKSLGINTAYVSEDIAGNQTFRTLARESGIEVYLIYPVFFNPEALQEDSTLWAITATGAKAKDHWVEFVCPSNAGYRKAAINRAKKAIHELKPDGLSIDFIRHFIYWEMVKPTDRPGDLTDACYCRNCLVQFAENIDLQYPDSLTSTVQYANYIRAHHHPDWIDSKCALITSMVRELTSEVRQAAPEIKFNLHAVPWRKEDYNGAASRIAGQDLSLLAPMVDFISPMCYTHMLFRDPEWVDSLVIDFQAQGVEKVLPCIQVSESYLEDPFAKEEFCACIKQSLKHQDNGIVFWSWEKLEQDSTKKQCVKDIVIE